MIHGAHDPREAPGAEADVGALFLRRVQDSTRSYLKTGRAPTEWTEIFASSRCDVREFGAAGDGVTDDTDAVRRALAACQSGDPAFGGQLYFPPGQYLITDTLRITDDRVRVHGEGLYISTINFRPRSARVLFDIGKTVGILYQCSISQLSLVGFGSAQKIAIRATDTSVLTVDTLSVREWKGGGTAAPSIALQMRGRDLLTVRRVSLFADRPISIEDNPRNSIDLDQTHFQDLYLGVHGVGESAIVIAPGINLTNVVMDGTNSIVTALHGIYWNSRRGTESSLSIRFSNIRCEQGQSKEGYAVYIAHDVQSVLLENIAADPIAQGFLLHGVRCATLINCFYPGAGVGLDLDNAANHDVALINCFFQRGSSVRTAAMREVMSMHKSLVGSPQAPVAFYDNATNGTGFVTSNGVRRFSSTGKLAPGASWRVPYPLGGRGLANVQLAARDESGAMEAGTFALSESTAVRISGTARTSDANTPNALCLSVPSQSAATLTNNLGRAITWVLSMEWAAE
ncbi:MAG: glycosyl hydrolase family 28-related protein [Gemmatimonadota bacterium]